MRIAVHEALLEYHLAVKLTQFQSHLLGIDVVLLQISLIVHLHTLTEFHRQQSASGEIPVHFGGL